MLHLVDAWFPRLEQAGWLPWLAVYMAVCVAVAGALHLCVERPFLMARDRRRGLSPGGSDIKVRTPFPLMPEPAGEDQNAV
jgi:peptidoglycan/LPS O-acetylase OafA/YrhL